MSSCSCIGFKFNRRAVRVEPNRRLTSALLARRPLRAQLTAMDVSARLRTLWDAPQLANARASIEMRDDELIDSQIAISEIAAPTGEEQERGEWVAARFRDLGLSGVHADEAGNVIGTRRGTIDEPPVVICAHLDTVFPRAVGLRVQRDGLRLLGPGIGDNGRGLAAMLALAGDIDGTSLRTRA